MFVPSDKSWQNADAIALLGSIINFICGENDREKVGNFIEAFTHHFTNFEDEEITYIGKCKVELGKVDKQLPIVLVTFTSQ